MADEVIAVKSLNKTKETLVTGFASIVLLMDAVQVEEVYTAYKKELNGK